MNYRLTALVIGFCAFGAWSQELEYENLKWEENPTWSALDTAYDKEQEVVLKFEKIVEFAYSEKYENQLVEYTTIHKIIRVFGDDAIQNHNKVYIGMYNTIELVEAKARVITPFGKVVDFDESNINNSESENGQIDYKYFAIDGVVKGSDIEYMYTILKVPVYNGSNVVFQDDFIHTNIDFALAAPDNLVFAFKSYNGFPDIVQDTTATEKNIYRVHADSVGAVADENYTTPGRNLKQLAYKLDQNKATYVKNIISFGEVSQTIYSIYYEELDGGTMKKLNAFVNKSGAEKGKTEEEKIRILESYIKKNIGIFNDVPTLPIKEIIANGFTSEKGVMTLTTQSLRVLGIKHELVLTCDRYDDYFDKDFEHYQVLRKFIIYFPSLKQYMAPSEMLFRLGMIPAEWTNQNGLFIKEIVAGDLKTGLGKVKFIAPLDYEKTQDNMDVQIDFTDLNAPVVKFERELLGYSSSGFQGVYSLIADEGKKELDEAYIKFADAKGEVLNYEVSGIAEEDIGVNPLVFKGELKTSTLVEKAGNRYLLNVGKLIGPQMEMYQEKERVYDIEHSHNMIYTRVIKFDVPAGYKISGLDSLKIHEYYPEENAKILFESDYVMEGNTVTITVHETYKEMSFKKEEINDFRRIINAAANFNHIVLFLVKE